MTELSNLPVDRLPADAAAVLFFSDERPPCGAAALLDWRLDGRLTSLLQGGGAVGDFGECLLLRSNRKVAAPWALFIGGGRRLTLDSDGLSRRLRHLFDVCRQAGFRQIALGLDLLPAGSAPELSSIAARVLEDIDGSRIDCRLARPSSHDAAALP